RGGSRYTITAYGRAALARMGANALLGVSRGSSAEPYLIHAAFKPSRAGKGKKRVILVGKGVTFDSGGLSIKTGKGMETMKCDMAGAASVLGVFHALTALSRSNPCPHEVHGLIPTAENMISGDSLKPGDVVKAMNGKTIEVLNTDAEGRLLLADALSYSAKLKGDIIIDLATLTGACVAAVGYHYAGLFTEDDDLASTLTAHGTHTGEELWRLPLGDAYRSHIDSAVADIKNIGPGGPGATTAALFLREFVPSGPRWAHLDIAGPAFIDRGNEYVPQGATGFGIRLLLDFLYSL
ncbi:MAG: leucyl aminopeptidase family protein, partial [Bdellovibrionales bacterium]|nr:leucyl aminopeptidase family protein [Bdellovibrionales bacterium]